MLSSPPATAMPALKVLLILLAVFSVPVRCLDRVVIESNVSYARSASIQARSARIGWTEAVTFLPLSTSDFAQARADGLWTAALDGPGDEQQQILLVRPQHISAALLHLQMQAVPAQACQVVWSQAWLLLLRAVAIRL